MSFATTTRYVPLSCLFWFAIGLTLAGIWTNVVGYSANLLPVDPAIGTNTYNRDAFLFGRLFIAIVFIIAARQIQRFHTAILSTMAVLMSCATGAFIISYHQLLFNPEIFSYVGIFISSCGYALMVWGFYAFLAKNICTDQIVICIAISLVCETVFSIVISLLAPMQVQILLVIFAPILVAVSYFVGTYSFRGTLQQYVSAIPLVGFNKYTQLGMMLLFTGSLVFVRALSNIGIWGTKRNNFTGMEELSLAELIVTCIILLVLTYLVFILPRKKFSLQFRCTIGLAVILAGLQILAVSNDYQFLSAFDTTTTAIEIFAHLVRWMVIVECIRMLNMPDYRISGISNVLYASLSLLWSHLIVNLEFATSIFVMIVIYVILLAVLALFARNTLSKNAALSQKTQSRETAVAKFAASYGLSPREIRILILLLDGNKRAQIEHETQLSEGTVKTHISNIYKKMDIHSKRELFLLYQKNINININSE
ncbi:MAG: LuxR C-terminal-related transcriptional regulator [Coriobacteriales bacterium]|jgi:DNA-binding CsgD family transcriptional regulator|nr:LuxR C-terminal-related transcriptional regulator [Coriobacteriales bacterium]